MFYRLRTAIRVLQRGGKILEDVTADFDEEDRKLVDIVRPYTMTSPERVFALQRAVEYIVRNDIPGDIVECGVWRGGSMMAAALTLKRLKAERTVHLFDTFEGMPPASNVDVDFEGNAASNLLQASHNKEKDWIWAYSGLSEVQKNLRSTGFPENLMQFHKGRVEDTIPGEAPSTIALLRLDTDWYESTKHELVHLYPRLVPGGVLIIDDYGHWEGARKAVDEFIAENRLKILLNRIDYSGRIAVKP